MFPRRWAIWTVGLVPFVGNAGAAQYCDKLAEHLQPGQLYAAKCAKKECLFAYPLSEQAANELYSKYSHILFMASATTKALNSLVVIQTKYLRTTPPASTDTPPDVVKLQRDDIMFSCSGSFVGMFPATRTRYPNDTYDVDLDIYQDFHVSGTGGGAIRRNLKNNFHGEYDTGELDGLQNCVSTLSPKRRQQYLLYDRDSVRPPADNIIGAVTTFFAPPPAMATTPNEFRQYESLHVTVKAYRRPINAAGCVEFDVDSAGSPQIDLVVEDLEEKAAYSQLSDSGKLRNYRLKYLAQ